MEFLTLEEIAKELRVHPRTIMRWLKNGSLKGYKLGNGKTSLLRIPKTEVIKFLEKHKIK
ncbi:MAG: helix-turn-helix domain-containing protein [Patescibacteria group bacterium]